MKPAQVFLLAAALLAAACSSPPPPPPAETRPPAPAFPPEAVAAAQGVLGAEAEVLLHGDLARTGQTQVLAIHRLKNPPKEIPPGTLITRATVLALEAGGKWREIFRCDDHLKNTQGYLGGTPLAPVNAWRLQYEQNEERGLQMYFTPLAQPRGGFIVTLGVRWNPRVKRYQTLDRNFETFLGETPVLESPSSSIRY